MALTIGNWVFVVILLLGGISIGIALAANDYQFGGVISIIVTLIICVLYIWIISWYHKNLASGVRAYKDYQSEMENGIEREILITAEDGREIFHYEGKVDIESNHTDNYIKFESEDGRRYMIYYGIQDTIQIIEKKGDN